MTRYKVVTESGNVYMREGPGYEYVNIGRCFRGGVYTIDESKSVPGWLYVTDGSLYDGAGAGAGYAAAEFFEPYVDPTPSYEPAIVFTRDEITAIRDYCDKLLRE